MARAKKSDGPPLVLVLANNKDSMTSSVRLSIGVVEFDDNGKRSLRWPNEAAGLYLANGALTLTAYRHSRSAYSSDEPRLLSLAHAAPKYHRTYGTDLSDAEAMVKTFRAIGKRLAAIRERFGHTDDFAETVLRFADAIGAPQIAVAWDLHREATGEGKPGHIDDHDGPLANEYHVSDPSYARGLLGAIARVDITARCRECRRPIQDGQTKCYDHREPLEQTAVDAVRAS